MIKEITGDLLTYPAKILCHQVNFHGVMGGGIAAAIRQKLLTDKEYGRYVRYCGWLGERALGTVLYSTTVSRRRFVANCFSQSAFGSGSA